MSRSWIQLAVAVVVIAAFASTAEAVVTQINTQVTAGAAPFATNDLINSGQPTFSSLTHTSGTFDAGFGNAATLNDGVNTFAFGTAFPITLTYNLNTALNPQGYDITSTRTATLSGGDNRRIQVNEVFYSLVGDASFVSLGGVHSFTPASGDGTITLVDSLAAPLAINVDAVRLVIYSNGFSSNETGYKEFDVFGQASQVVPEPSGYVAFTLALLMSAIGYWNVRRSLSRSAP